ncbi:MAG: hypothetical protein UX20_C0044G0005 [Candidatus Magasanikbacteria bacterium GW2011_GWC2_45_8]|uniref:Uncharacterized protein n=1 Tax=Candidatus Magasanikbacteria bacterium GW2011_GWC2_45_8 TaxID=1619050 RepID=A0A0G1MX37_9BACT|nr:MAG: hypothetical protein UX20_C0044G0005 [Candidatus Magasanikbacteria bacterium GW2011_GWC2_45_8]
MEKKISYKLKRSRRAKRMRLAVYCDGTVVVTSPYGIQQSIIEKFIADKKQWVLSKIQFFKSILRTRIRLFLLCLNELHIITECMASRSTKSLLKIKRLAGGVVLVSRI